MAHWTPMLALLLPALLVAVFFPLQADTELQGGYTTASCFRKETYNTTSKVKVQIPVNKTRYDWCLGGFMRCMVYKVEMAEREINVTEIRSRIVEMCCPGTIPAPGTPAHSTNESLHCIPAPGSATPPMTTAATTTTSSSTPREVCKAGLWGPGCSHTCECRGEPCDQDTGACKATNPSCSPFNKTCGSSSSTTVTSSSTTSTTPLPTSPSATRSPSPPSTPRTTPVVITTPSRPSSTSTTTPSTTSTSTTMISTLATTKTSTQRTVETSPRVISPSNVPEIPLGASTESPRTVSTTGPSARLTTVRPAVATREHATIERRKEAPGKSMAQPAKTTAQPIDPESVNRVDISPGNGKPKPDTLPTNSSFVSTLTPISSPPPPPLTSSSNLTPSSTRLSYPLATTPEPSNLKPTTTTTTSKLTLPTQTPMTTTTPRPLSKPISPKTEDSSSEESESEEDSEEDMRERKDFKKMREETILSPPEKPATRIDRIQTKINGSQHLMTWTFQTDFSVGPPIKFGTPAPRKNAISTGVESRSTSAPHLDKNAEDKLGATTVTYGVKPWMPALNLATETPRLDEQTTRQNFLDKEIRNSYDNTTPSSTSTQQLTTPRVSPRNDPVTPKNISKIVNVENTTLVTSTETLKSSPSTEKPTEKTTSRPSSTVTYAVTLAKQPETVAPIKVQTSAPTTSLLTTIVNVNFTKQKTTPHILPSTPPTKFILTEVPTNATTTTSPLPTPSILTPKPTLPTERPTYQTSSSTYKTSTTLKVPSVSIPAEPPPVSVHTVVIPSVQTTSTTLGLRDQTTLQGHVRTQAESIEVTSRKGG